MGRDFFGRYAAIFSGGASRARELFFFYGADGIYRADPLREDDDSVLIARVGEEPVGTIALHRENQSVILSRYAGNVAGLFKEAQLKSVLKRFEDAGPDLFWIF